MPSFPIRNLSFTFKRVFEKEAKRKLNAECSKDNHIQNLFLPPIFRTRTEPKTLEIQTVDLVDDDESSQDESSGSDHPHDTPSQPDQPGDFFTDEIFTASNTEDESLKHLDQTADDGAKDESSFEVPPDPVQPEKQAQHRIPDESRQIMILKSSGLDAETGQAVRQPYSEPSAKSEMKSLKKAVTKSEAAKGKPLDGTGKTLPQKSRKKAGRPPKASKIPRKAENANQLNTTTQIKNADASIIKPTAVTAQEPEHHGPSTSAFSQTQNSDVKKSEPLKSKNVEAKQQAPMRRSTRTSMAPERLSFENKKGPVEKRVRLEISTPQKERPAEASRLIKKERCSPVEKKASVDTVPYSTFNNALSQHYENFRREKRDDYTCHLEPTCKFGKKCNQKINRSHWELHIIGHYVKLPDAVKLTCVLCNETPGSMAAHWKQKNHDGHWSLTIKNYPQPSELINKMIELIEPCFPSKQKDVTKSQHTVQVPSTSLTETTNTNAPSEAEATAQPDSVVKAKASKGNAVDTYESKDNGEGHQKKTEKQLPSEPEPLNSKKDSEKPLKTLPGDPELRENLEDSRQNESNFQSQPSASAPNYDALEETAKSDAQPKPAALTHDKRNKENPMGNGQKSPAKNPCASKKRTASTDVPVRKQMEEKPAFINRIHGMKVEKLGTISCNSKISEMLSRNPFLVPETQNSKQSGSKKEAVTAEEPRDATQHGKNDELPSAIPKSAGPTISRSSSSVRTHHTSDQGSSKGVLNRSISNTNATLSPASRLLQILGKNREANANKPDPKARATDTKPAESSNLKESASNILRKISATKGTPITIANGNLKRKLPKTTDGESKAVKLQTEKIPKAQNPSISFPENSEPDPVRENTNADLIRNEKITTPKNQLSAASAAENLELNKSSVIPASSALKTSQQKSQIGQGKGSTQIVQKKMKKESKVVGQSTAEERDTKLTYSDFLTVLAATYRHLSTQPEPIKCEVKECDVVFKEKTMSVMERHILTKHASPGGFTCWKCKIVPENILDHQKTGRHIGDWVPRLPKIAQTQMKVEELIDCLQKCFPTDAFGS